MGGKSKSSSSQSSNQKSFSQALYGDNSGVMIGGDGNTVNFTDFGAVESALSFASGFGDSALTAVMDSNANMAAVADNGLALADSLGHGAFELASDVTGTNAELANQAMMINGSLVSDSFSLADSMSSSFLNAGADMFGAGAELIDQSGQRNLEAALAVHDTGLQQLQLGTDFVTQLNQQSLDTNLQAQRDNNDALTGGFKSAMQFVEGFSRSDGNAVAETNMKTVGILSLAAIGVAFAVKKGN